MYACVTWRRYVMELHVAARAARHWLQDHGLNPVRMYVGVFMSALNMTGLSITLCKVDQLRQDHHPLAIEQRVFRGTLSIHNPEA